MPVTLKPLHDQVIVLTGASSGIGLVTARLAAARGAKILLVARNGDALAEAVRGIRAAGGTADHAVADVGDAAQVDAAAARAVALFGRIDTWVNNAGVAIYARLLDTPDDEHERLFRTNYFGTVHGCRTAVAHLRVQGGALITVGSIASELPTPVMAAYAASKHAAKAYIDGLRMELIADRVPISVTLIKPSGIDTPIARHAADHLDGEARIPPIVYDPALVAEAILDAAVHRRREVTVGGAGRAQVLLGLHFPRMLDRMAGYMMPLLSDPATPKTVEDNLFAPMTDGSPRGAQPGRRTSIYTTLRRNPSALGMAALGGIAAGLLVWKSRGASAESDRGSGKAGVGRSIPVTDTDWTTTDLDLLHSLQAGGVPIDQMARRVGRTRADVEHMLAAVKDRDTVIPVQSADHGPNAWFGSDEEGDVAPPSGRPLDDPDAWVHATRP